MQMEPKKITDRWKEYFEDLLYMEIPKSLIPKWNDDKAEPIMQDVTINKIRKEIQSLTIRKLQVVTE